MKIMISFVVALVLILGGGYVYNKHTQKVKVVQVEKELKEAQEKFLQARTLDYNKLRDQEILACLQEVEKSHSSLTPQQLEAKSSTCRDQGNAWAGCLVQKGNVVDPTNIAECRKNMEHWKKTGYK